MTPQAKLASGAAADSAAGDPAALATATSPFVLNLCSSSTPMALAQTDLPELKRFTFFVSRRFEEGRERFRLHMGYFATLAEAEEWLAVVREIYPGAWAGEAPGRKLRERAAAAAAAQAQHAAGPQPQMAAAPARRPAALPPPPAQVPVVHAAVPAPQRAPAPPRAPMPVASPSAAVARAAAARPAAARPAAARPEAAKPQTRTAPAPAVPQRAVTPPAAARPAPKPAVAAKSPPPVVRPPAPAAPAPAVSRGPARPAARPAFEDSNVREVLAALGDASATGETRLMHAPPPPRVTAPAGDDPMSDTQVLRMLEARRPEGAEPPENTVGSNIPMLKPDDTGTRAALKEAVVTNAAVSFAVQLQWSVQPVELEKVPPLAIFSAYTLYTVEGSREGRKWYGLRLGFFSDAISAKQVAYYVRSEFTSVAVVPVSPQEKARATEDDRLSTFAAGPAPRRSDEDEFKLFDDSHDVKIPVPAAVPAAKPGVRPGTAHAAAPAARGGRNAGKVAARERRTAQTLEETLEILGASQLAIDDGSRETLNDSGVRHLRVEVQQQKNSPFARLLERLSDRVKKQ
jgi:hypothetical protein